MSCVKRDLQNWFVIFLVTTYSFLCFLCLARESRFDVESERISGTVNHEASLRPSYVLKPRLLMLNPNGHIILFPTHGEARVELLHMFLRAWYSFSLGSTKMLHIASSKIICL